VRICISGVVSVLCLFRQCNSYFLSLDSSENWNRIQYILVFILRQDPGF
jgi:hypothetical protein